jgi:hypothetical protein
MGVIDADAHVIETERTWSFMLEEDRRLAPELLVSTKNGVEYWRIDDRVFPNSNLGLNVPEESRDLTDVNSRVAHMDALGIDIQVLYPSLRGLYYGTIGFTSPARLRMIFPTSSNTPAKTISWSAPITAMPTTPTTSRRFKPSPTAAKSPGRWRKKS